MRSFILLFGILLYCSSFTYGQTFHPDHIVHYKGSYINHDAYYSDNNGNEYLAGRGTGSINFVLNGSASNTLPTNAWRDIYLAKYDKDKNLEWLLNFDGNSVGSQITSIITDAEDNVYVAGSFIGTMALTKDGNHTITSFNAYSMFVVKFDKSGNLLWKFKIGNGSFDQYPEDIFLSDNKLKIHAILTGTVDTDPGPANNTIMVSSSTDAFLEFDLNGIFNGIKSHGGYTVINTTVIDKDLNIYQAGNFSGTSRLDYNGNQTVSSTGLTDAYLAKYDKNYNLIWLKSFGDFLNVCSFDDIAINAKGEIIATGKFEKNTKLGQYTILNTANYLTKFDKAGNVVKVLEVLPNTSNSYSLSIDAAGNVYYVASYDKEIDIDPSEKVLTLPFVADKSYLLLAKFDPNFNLLGADYIYAKQFWGHTNFVNVKNEVVIMQTFVEGGKCVFGSNVFYLANGDENFVSYRLPPKACVATAGQLMVFGCDSVAVNNEVYHVTGQYQQKEINVMGCDSTITVDVTIHGQKVTKLVIQACDDYSFDGNILTIPGQYVKKALTSNGCDSTVTLDLSFIKIDTSLMLVGGKLKAGQNDATYRWINCIDNEIIPGEADQIFSPSKNGSYKVEINLSDCIKTSRCFNFVTSATEENGIFNFSLSPNPATDIIHISIDKNLSLKSGFITDMSGKVIRIFPELKTGETSIDISGLISGFYVFHVTSNRGIWHRKICKQ